MRRKAFNFEVLNFIYQDHAPIELNSIGDLNKMSFGDYFICSNDDANRVRVNINHRMLDVRSKSLGPYYIFYKPAKGWRVARKDYNHVLHKKDKYSAMVIKPKSYGKKGLRYKGLSGVISSFTSKDPYKAAFDLGLEGSSGGYCVDIMTPGTFTFLDFNSRNRAYIDEHNQKSEYKVNFIPVSGWEPFKNAGVVICGELYHLYDNRFHCYDVGPNKGMIFLSDIDEILLNNRAIDNDLEGNEEGYIERYASSGEVFRPNSNIRLNEVVYSYVYGKTKNLTINLLDRSPSSVKHSQSGWSHLRSGWIDLGSGHGVAVKIYS